MTETIFSMVLIFLIVSIGDFYLGSAFHEIVLIMAAGVAAYALFAIYKCCMLLWMLFRGHE
jgi:hypothetical protein